MQHLAPIQFIHLLCHCGSHLYHVNADCHHGNAYKGIAKLHAKQEGCQFALVKNNLEGRVACPFCGTFFELANDIVLQKMQRS